MLVTICPNCFAQLCELGFPAVELMESAIFTPFYVNRLYLIRDKKEITVSKFLEKKRFILTHEDHNGIHVMPIIKKCENYDSSEWPVICLRALNHKH